MFENPILKSRAPGCSEADRELGEARQAHVSAMQRLTASLVDLPFSCKPWQEVSFSEEMPVYLTITCLPSVTSCASAFDFDAYPFTPDEYVVFVTPSTIQKAMFAKILQPDTLSSLVRGSMARSLAMIQYLTKLSSSPMLLKSALEKQTSKWSDDDDVPDTRGAIENALKLLPTAARLEDVSQSGMVLCQSMFFMPTNDFYRQINSTL